MLLTLVTLEKEVFSSIPVEEIIVPGKTGELGILPEHAPLISTLGEGKLKYRLKGESAFQEMQVQWGYCEVQSEQVIILAESAKKLEQ